MANPPDDPFAPSDATILRPRPGRRAQGQSPVQPAAPVAPGQRPLPQMPAPAAAAAAPAAASIGEFVSTGLNPLVRAAVPLLVLAGRLRGQIANADVESLRRQCVQEMHAFEQRARGAGVAAEDVLAARYALCTVLDEAVLNTPWGAQSGWASQSLLVTFHREASGGEKFFLILERLLSEPQRYQALLELLYVCLALGFEGRYRLDEHGAQRLADVRENLYRQIAALRGGVEPELSPQWKGVQDRRNSVLRLVPLWVVAAACAVLLVGAYIYFNARLTHRSSALSALLAAVGTERVETPPARLNAAPSGFTRLLAPEIAKGVVQVQEQGARTLITLTVPDLFASGSARLNSRYVALVHAIGKAAARVPGRLIVTGHTDDVPVHSLRFHDNFELSRARARDVARLLQQDLPDAGPIEAIGKGASDPRYKPADLPANRARNRRVEIVHLRDE